jgi:hypothetical protein
MSRTCIPRCQPGWIGTLPECVPISRRVPVRDGEAGTSAGPRQRPAGATFRDSAACPRLAKGSDDPRLFRGRPAQRNRPAIVLNRRSPTPRHPSRPTGERRPVAPRYPAAARRAQRNRDSVPRYLRGDDESGAVPVSSLDSHRLACRDPAGEARSCGIGRVRLVSELFENDLLTCFACRTEGKGW